MYNESYNDVARKIGDITQYGVRYERVERPGYIIGWSNNAGDWFLSRPVVKGTIETLDCNQVITPMIEEQAKPLANRAELLVTRIKRWEKYEAAKNSQYSGQRQKQEYFTFLSHVRGVPAFRRAGPADVVPVNRILQNIKAVTNRVNTRR